MYMTADVADRAVTFSCPGTFLGSEHEQVANFVGAERGRRTAGSVASRKEAHVRPPKLLARKMLGTCVTVLGGR
jgi:hypothetical protein